MKRFITNTLKGLGATGGIVAIIVVFVGLFFVLPIILIFGLNLMGFELPYTFKTVFGASLVCLALRGSSSSSKD
jgi:hypothetical protein